MASRLTGGPAHAAHTYPSARAIAMKFFNLMMLICFHSGMIDESVCDVRVCVPNVPVSLVLVGGAGTHSHARIHQNHAERKLENQSRKLKISKARAIKVNGKTRSQRWADRRKKKKNKNHQNERQV